MKSIETEKGIPWIVAKNITLIKCILKHQLRNKFFHSHFVNLTYMSSSYQIIIVKVFFSIVKVF